MKLINTRSVNVIYCDDVRHEVGGKITVVGIYPDGMPVPYPPQGSLALAKFCLIATMRTPTDQPLRRLRCELRLDDEVLHGIEVPQEAIDANTPMRENQKWVSTQLMMEFGNFPIPQEGILRFVAIVDENEVYECPGIQFLKIENQMPATTSAPAA